MMTVLYLYLSEICLPISFLLPFVQANYNSFQGSVYQNANGSHVKMHKLNFSHVMKLIRYCYRSSLPIIGYVSNHEYFEQVKPCGMDDRLGDISTIQVTWSEQT